MTLPPCIINLTPQHYCPPGQHWDGTQCVDDPTPPQTGTGDAVYVSTLQGLGYCHNARSSARQWFNLNGTAPNNLTGNAVKIRTFNLDPHSLSTDHLSAGWAVTDDGFYRATDLRGLNVWTRQLTVADVATLVGTAPIHDPAHPYSSYGIGKSFTPSTQIPGFVAVMCYGVTGVNADHYFVYSLDYGATWHCNQNNYFFEYSTTASRVFYCQASNHVANTYYISGFFTEAYYGGSNHDFGSTGDKVFLARYVGDLSGSPEFVPVQSYAIQFANVGGYVVFPYSDSNGAAYTTDARMYLVDEWSQNVNAVQKCTSAMNPLWPTTPYPAFTGIGEAGHGWSPTAGSRINLGFYIHSFDENRMAIIAYPFCSDKQSVWTTTLGNAPWTQHQPSVSDEPLLKSLSMILAEPKVFFLSAQTTFNGGEARCWYTEDFGGTFTRFDNPASGSLDAVMGLGLGDMDDSTIVCDPYYSNALPPSITATMLDVSHYQGTMNWATAAGQGIAVAFMKATQGASYTDPQFSTNWSGAGAQGIARGSYHYFENATNPTTQANHYVAIATSAGEKGYAVDCEDETAALDPVDLKTFLDRVETLTGQKCTIYTRASWWNKYVGYQSWASQYPLWVAHWNAAVPTLPTGWTNWVYWQFSSLGSGSQYGAQSTFIDLNKVLA